MGGAEYQARLLVEHWLAHYDVDIVYLTVRTDPGYRPADYQIVKFSTDTGIRRYVSFVDALRLYRALRAIRPDVIYQQVGCAHTGIAAFYARRNGCTMVWRIASDRTVAPLQGSPWRRPHHWIERRFLEYGIRHAAAIYAQNGLQQRLLRERYGRDCVLVRNFHPAPPGSDPAPAAGRKRTVVWIGNMKPLKNPGAFLRLARAFATRGDVDFVMIGARTGAGRWTQELMAGIAACANVRYLGVLAPHDVDEQLRRSCVLVNTSDDEGFPNTFVQAWLRGVPVVSLHADPDELLSKGGCGFVSGTEERLREDVERLVDSPQEAGAIGGAARAYALRAHSMGNADHLARLLGFRRLDGSAAGAGAPEARRAAGVELMAGA
jgi:glycosyltransferase involved in cell wall biosynthesis